ncbi:MAG: amidohydrolase [Deltaproteobacteria bacterium]|nr:amidohydrolase [Deltaproteobacteria bacterium]
MIDCHMHLHESMVSLPGIVASMDKFGIQRTALIPRLNPPIYAMPLLLRMTTPLLRKILYSDGGWLHGLALKMYESWSRDDGTVLIGLKRYKIIAAPDNTEVTSALKHYPDRFWGWIFVNPRCSTDPLAEIEKYCHVPGMIGVKAHPYWHNYPIQELIKTAELCTENNLPMLIHLGVKQHGDYNFLPSMFPKLKVIYAHAGVPYGHSVCELAGEMKNVFIDLSSPAYMDIKTAHRAIAKAGANKCLFGSDGPYLNTSGDRYDYGPITSIVKALDLSEDDRARIERLNFIDILQ